MENLKFYRGRKVFITGHTGFKGSWLCKILTDAGAAVTGYALAPPARPNLFDISGVEEKVTSIYGDVRDLDLMKRAFDQAQPEIVLHLAAQPIVHIGYDRPAYTYETNIMGTVHILECIRQSDCVRSFLNVTTDKVYRNYEWEWGYRENDTLDGFDPYSNSKSCSELVTHSYKDSFFADRKVALSTARAGNVIGGGDFAQDRIVPDCVRAAEQGTPVLLRYPHSVRPYQHVLEPLFAYLLIAQKQYEDPALAGWYNVGPDDCDCITTGGLADIFCTLWGEGASWESQGIDGPHEADFLKLDCAKIKTALGWKPRWHIEEAVKKTVEWTKVYLEGGDVAAEMSRQIMCYLGE